MLHVPTSSTRKMISSIYSFFSIRRRSLSFISFIVLWMCVCACVCAAHCVWTTHTFGLRSHWLRKHSEIAKRTNEAMRTHDEIISSSSDGSASPNNQQWVVLLKRARNRPAVPFNTKNSGACTESRARRHHRRSCVSLAKRIHERAAQCCCCSGTTHISVRLSVSLCFYSTERVRQSRSIHTFYVDTPHAEFINWCIRISHMRSSPAMQCTEKKRRLCERVNEWAKAASVTQWWRKCETQYATERINNNEHHIAIHNTYTLCTRVHDARCRRRTRK